jgi:hypothetical protein
MPLPSYMHLYERRKITEMGYRITEVGWRADL